MKIEILFGQILRLHRKEADFTQEGLALDCGLDRTYISLLERGKRNITLVSLFKIAKSLKIEPSRLVQEIEQQGGELISTVHAPSP